MSQFTDYIQGVKTALVISSDPLDPDCICSGLITKKYLESLGIQTRQVFPREKTKKQKEAFSYLPFFNEVEFTDTRLLLAQKNFDLLVMVDGGNLNQFYDTSESFDNSINLDIYEKRVNIDHHLTNQKLGDLMIHRVEVSSATELALELLPDEFITPEIATLGYAGIVGDTGNFKWNFFSSTLKMAAKLIEKGANTEQILEKFFFSKTRQDLELLRFVLDNIIFVEELRTCFLYLPIELLTKNQIDREKLDIIKDIFKAEFARSIQGYDRGFILVPKNEKFISVSGRGSNLNNKIALPELLDQLNGRGGGHFNAAGTDVEGTFDEIKEKLLSALKSKILN